MIYTLGATRPTFYLVEQRDPKTFEIIRVLIIKRSELDAVAR